MNGADESSDVTVRGQTLLLETASSDSSSNNDASRVKILGTGGGVEITSGATTELKVLPSGTEVKGI